MVSDGRAGLKSARRNSKAILGNLVSPEDLAKLLRYKNTESLRAVLRKLGPKDGVYRHGQRHILIDPELYMGRLKEGKLGSKLD